MTRDLEFKLSKVQGPKRLETLNLDIELKRPCALLLQARRSTDRVS